MANNNLFDRMCKEAMEELASGDKGWKDVDPNTLLLVCFGMLTNHLTHNLARPLWFFASTIFAAVVGYLIHLCLTGG